MKLYPKGDTPEAAGYLSVYLSNQVRLNLKMTRPPTIAIIFLLQTETEVKARYEFTILDVSKNKQNRVKSTFTQFKVGFKNCPTVFSVHCSWYLCYCGYHQEINLVAGETGLLGLPQVYFHRLPQVAS